MASMETMSVISLIVIICNAISGDAKIYFNPEDMIRSRTANCSVLKMRALECLDDIFSQGFVDKIVYFRNICEQFDNVDCLERYSTCLDTYPKQIMKLGIHQYKLGLHSFCNDRLEMKRYVANLK